MPPAATPPPASATMSYTAEPGAISAPPTPNSRKAIAARIPICPNRSRRMSERSMLNVTAVSRPSSPSCDRIVSTRVTSAKA